MPGDRDRPRGKVVQPARSVARSHKPPQANTDRDERQMSQEVQMRVGQCDGPSTQIGEIQRNGLRKYTMKEQVMSEPLMDVNLVGFGDRVGIDAGGQHQPRQKSRERDAAAESDCRKHLDQTRSIILGHQPCDDPRR